MVHQAMVFGLDDCSIETMCQSLNRSLAYHSKKEWYAENSMRGVIKFKQINTLDDEEFR